MKANDVILDHMYFDYNFGLYLTLWDRIGGTHRNPSANYGKGPLDQVRKDQEAEAFAAGTKVEAKPKAA